MRVYIGLILASLFMLAGCPGDTTPPSAVSQGPSGPPGPPGPGGSSAAEPAEGLWHGSITSTVSGNSRELIGLVGGWADTVLIAEDGQYYGVLHRTDISYDTAEFTANLTGIVSNGFSWPNGSTVADYSFNGTISPPTAISGDYSGAGDSGTFSLDFDPASSRGSDLKRTLGMWVLRDTSQNIIATFDVGGVLDPWAVAINGSDVNGCVYTGDVTGDDWLSVYIYPMSLNVSNCPTGDGTHVNGVYGGSGAVTDIEPGSNRDDQFIVGVNNDEHVITLVLEKL